MTDDPIRLRLILDMCRRLLWRINDEETTTRLTAKVEECEQKLSDLQSRPADDPSPTRKP